MAAVTEAAALAEPRVGELRGEGARPEPAEAWVGGAAGWVALGARLGGHVHQQHGRYIVTAAWDGGPVPTGQRGRD